MKHIIFDLGNVLVRLDAEACRRAFQKAGMETLVERSNNEARTILNQLGLGIIRVLSEGARAFGFAGFRRGHLPRCKCHAC